MRGLVVAFAVVAAVAVGRADAPVTVVVVIDGLSATTATPERLPRLAARATATHSTWTTALGVLPARTNPNHASILTGYWPDGHGIVGNRYWDAVTRTRVPMEQPRLLEAETIFDVLAAERPRTRVAAYFGKAKLRRLFRVASDAGDEPKVVWDPGGEYASDETTLLAARRSLEGEVPETLVVVGIADVDRASHQAGPATTVADQAIERVDRLVDRFLDVIVDRGLWDRTVVIVTADHGFARVDEGGAIELPAGIQSGLVWVDEGRVALGHVVAGDAPAAVPVSILTRPGIAGVRSSLPGIGLGHPRAGTLMLIAAPGFVFALDAGAYRMRGDHGGDEERAVPFVVVGGHPSLRRLPADVHPELPDVAPTLAAILGVRDPRSRRDGERRRGRRLPVWAAAPSVR